MTRSTHPDVKNPGRRFRLVVAGIEAAVVALVAFAAVMARLRLEYDAVIYAIDDEGFPYHFVDGEPTWTGPQFDKATAKICAAHA